MSKTVKIIIGVIIVLLIVCVCAAGVTFYSAKQIVSQSFTFQEDPEQVANVARGIVDYTLPPGYSEQFGMSIFGFDMVAFGRGQDFGESGGAIILLAQFPQSLGLDQAEMQRQMEQSIQQQSGRQLRGITVVDQVPVTIRDQAVTLTVSEGTDEKGNQVRQITGVFEGKGGTTMLMIMGNPQQWNQAEIDAFINSLH